MTEHIIMTVFIFLSVLFAMIPLLQWLFQIVRVVVNPKKRKVHTFNTKLIFVSAFLMFSIWFLRFAVGMYMNISYEPGDEREALTLWEEIFNSAVHALQSFSMDEDYTVYLSEGKEMVSVLLDGRFPKLVTAFGIYASVLNVIAPVLGGAFLLVILMSVSTKITMFFLYCLPWKEKYFFNNLNEMSLSLAKSIRGAKTNIFTRPTIIFTDVYDLNEGGIDADIILEANLYGAVCLKDNVHLMWKNRFGKRKFFLIQEDEIKNLQELSSLTNKYNYKYLKNAEIYLFVQQGTYNQLEKKIYEKLRDEYGFTEDELPVLVPVLSYRNMISNMLVELPLYEPIINKEKDEEGKRDLNVTILGTGSIGTEMFLSTYWFGQILNTRLNINVISQESKETFEGKIDYINPEIMKTAKAGDDILKYNDGEYSDPYFNYKYVECEAKSSKFVEMLTGNTESVNLLDTDYFLVALGSDNENVSVANELLRYVGQHHIEKNTNKNEERKTVIAYVVYNSDFANALNVQKHHSSLNNGVTDIYMKAVGSLEEVYSAKNVFLSEYRPLAEMADQAYISAQNAEERAVTHKKRIKDDYKYWANIARSMHLKYRVFSLELFRDSLFDYAEDDPAYAETVRETIERYKSVISGNMEIPDIKDSEQFNLLLHKMAWLEHRRWCAFTRIKGFRNTQSYDNYSKTGDTGSYKHMLLKLHPCLRECDEKGIRAGLKNNGKIDEKKIFLGDRYDKTKLDYLDELSLDLYKKQYNDYDFKMYDYPIDDFKN